jgi:transposase-like protein
MSRRIISKKVREAAVRSCVKDGVSIADAAKNVGVGYESVRRWLKQAGIDTSRGKYNAASKLPNAPKKGGSYPRLNSVWSKGEDEILRDAVLSGMTVKETAELLGRTKASIYARKWGLIGKGFIENPESRFVMPDDIKRPRKEDEAVFEIEPEVVAILEEIENTEIEDVKDEPIVVKTVENISIPNFEELARIVDKYGVNVSLSVNTTGNVEVMMSK